MFPFQLSQNRANKKSGWNMPAFNEQWYINIQSPHVLLVEKVIRGKEQQKRFNIPRDLTASLSLYLDNSSARQHPGPATDSNNELLRSDDHEYDTSKLESIHYESQHRQLPRTPSSTGTPGTPCERVYTIQQVFRPLLILSRPMLLLSLPPVAYKPWCLHHINIAARHVQNDHILVLRFALLSCCDHKRD